MVAVSDFSGLVSSACALANAAAMVSIDAEREALSTALPPALRALTPKPHQSRLSQTEL